MTGRLAATIALALVLALPAAQPAPAQPAPARPAPAEPAPAEPAPARAAEKAPPAPPRPVTLVVLGSIDRARATAVLTHGMQPTDKLAAAPGNLWVGGSGLKAASLIRSETWRRGAPVNIVLLRWDDAFQVSGLPDRLEYIRAWQGVSNAAHALARQLNALLGAGYDRPVHFIGHSLGAVINTFAARQFLARARGVTAAQITALERPHRLVNRLMSLFGLSEPPCLAADTPPCRVAEADREVLGATGTDAFERRYRWDRRFLAAALQDLHREFESERCKTAGPAPCGLRIENYYSHDPTAAGERALGPVLNERLIDPKMVGGDFFIDETVEGLVNHSGVHQWYRWTIDPARFALSDLTFPGLCHGRRLNDAVLYHDSLNPCRRGWTWSLLGPLAARFPVRRLGRYASLARQPLRLAGESATGCTLADTGAAVVCAAVPARARLSVDLPTDARYLEFTFRFTGAGPRAYAAVMLDGRLLWKAAAPRRPVARFTVAGPLPLGLARPRNHRLTVGFYGATRPGARLELRGWTAVRVPRLR